MTSELDVRQIPKPQKHPAIFGRFAELKAGGSFVLVNDHDPQHLHEEFEEHLAGKYDWEYVDREPGDWQIRITRLTDDPLPPALADLLAWATKNAKRTDLIPVNVVEHEPEA